MKKDILLQVVGVVADKVSENVVLGIFVGAMVAGVLLNLVA